MDDTPNLKLPYIMAAQAQKHVTHNEAIRALDAVVQVSVADRNLAVPPPGPADGDRYIIAAGATGAWAGNEGKLAAWQDGAWAFYAPLEGWLAWVADEDALVVWDGTAWITEGASAFTDLADVPAGYAGSAGKVAVVKSDETGLEFAEEVPRLGINAAPDATNRLAIAAEASLFNHAGAGHQHKINKNTAGDTASLLFQTGFSGRAEFGTTGDDDWHVKVSPNGTTWHEAIVVDKDTGHIGVGTGAAVRRLDVLDGSAPQLRLTNTDGVDYADLQVDGDGNLSILPSGSGVAVYADNSGAELSGAFATIEQDGAGDAVLQWLLTGTRSWYAGIDNSDSDKWKLATTTGTPSFATDSILAVSPAMVFAGVPLRATKVQAGVNAGALNFGELYHNDDYLVISTSKVFGTGHICLVPVSGGFVGVATASPTCSLHVNGPARVGSYAVAGVPSASAVGAGTIIYVSDEAGGAVLAFSDGTDWRRVTDRAVIS